MAQQTINIGSMANDGGGDPLRVAFQKINSNFNELFSTSVATNTVITSTTQNHVLMEIPVENFTQGIFQINSAVDAGIDSQNITINACLNNDKTDVKWVGYNTIILNDPLVTYDMIVQDGKVKLLVNQLVDTSITNLIAAQIT